MPQRFQLVLAWIGVVVGIALVGIGFYVESTPQWRLQLLVGLLLLAVLPWMLIGKQLPLVTRGLARLSLVFILGFTAVALQLAREQISQASVTRERVATLFQPISTTIPEIERRPDPADRTSLGTQKVWPVRIDTSQRGHVLSRDNIVITDVEDGRRIYPDPNVGHIIGFNSRLYGTSGIEASYGEYLAGMSVLSPTTMLESRLLGTPVETSPAGIRLVLDMGLQRVAQNALGDRKGAVVLLDPRTGAILALATYPRFDPNQLMTPDQASEEDVAQVQAAWEQLTSNPDSPLLNRATQGRYPPGSVIKTLTAAAALDGGVIDGPGAEVTCPNRLPTEAGAPPVRNAVENLDQRTGDPSDLNRVFAFSCNTAFAQLGLALGPERFADYAERFGLHYANEEGLTPDLRDVQADVGSIATEPAFLEREAALADTAYGQGQALVTPLDMAQMVAVIANDGKLMRPYIVERVRDSVSQEVLFQREPEVLREVISPQAAQQMREVMKQSVEIGYAKPVELPGVSIGAKTGTAEVSSGDPHSWFVAIAPVEQPRFAIAVIVENGGEGSRSALPVARQVLAAALGVQP
ncbi:MAG: penicillin-binding protein 2 [Chloroflexi bacterium AL-W]|nr:penicillin-binding protein 2 [Chloroflexi bacterium AL-N1]NOK72276.1 penicillin-binding protein 2 [Chloroflexi bacterium AL-N5]NOK79638.1 penicillin-binding protein 2 [Chloroflexi bacterium AL-W]NOK87553.1 penicillin-binding protein 2 [Chloroflexi bacterium AL-N15]